MPSRVSGYQPSRAESSTTTAPAAARSQPVPSPARRPRARDSAASGTAASAAPRVTRVVARPASDEEPVRCSTSRPPEESVDPMPSPATIWAAISTRTVRRWAVARSGTDGVRDMWGESAVGSAAEVMQHRVGRGVGGAGQ